MSSTLAVFHVPGRARTKGSLKVITPRGQKPRLIEDHALSKPWRTRMSQAFKIQAKEVLSEAYAGPVGVRITFVFERTGPAAQLLPWPTVNSGVNAIGDLDKLERNVLDALQDAKIIVDDSQVCELSSSKMWGWDAGVGVVLNAL